MDEQPVSTMASGLQEPTEFGTKFLDALGQAQQRQDSIKSQETAPEKKEEAPSVKPEAAKPQSKEPAKAPEPDKKSPLDFPTDPDVPKTIKSTKAADDFKRIKAERDQALKQIEELKSSQAAAPQDDFKAKLNELTKEKDELSNRLKLLDIERHPEFQKKYTSKIEGIVGKVNELVGAESSKLMALMAMEQTDDVTRQIDDIVGNLNPTKQAKLGAYIVEYERTQTERNQEIEQAKTQYQKTVDQLEAQQRQAIEQRSLEDQATWDRVSKAASVLEVFEAREDDNDWNREVNQRIETAKSIFTGNNSPEDLAKASLWAAAGPKYRELLYAEMELRKRAETELSKYRKAEPGVASAGEDNKASSDKNMGFADRVAAMMRG